MLVQNYKVKVQLDLSMGANYALNLSILNKMPAEYDYFQFGKVLLPFYEQLS